MPLNWIFSSMVLTLMIIVSCFLYSENKNSSSLMIKSGQEKICFSWYW